MPTDLPPNTQQHLQCRQAYQRCLDMEEHWKLAQGQGLSPLVCARVLGQLIIQAPSQEGREYVAREINSCKNETEMKALAKLYVTHFIRCFRASKGATPIPSEHPSRESWNFRRETHLLLLKGVPQNHETAKTLALKRDRYRCVVSNKLDTSSVMEGKVEFTRGEYVATTHLSHILSSSTGENIDGPAENGPKHHYAASVATILDSFGGVLLVDELNGPDIHRLPNVLTLSQQLHTYFDSLTFWLEETETKNQYRPKAVPDFLLDGLDVPEIITLTTPDPVQLPLPDPRYLRLHAACARVAHMSGAAEAVESVIRDTENTAVLASDGGSDELLTIALARATIRGVV